MEKQDHDLGALEVLDQTAKFLQEIGEEIFIEERINKTIEIDEVIRCEQEVINLIDRIRNTENEITVTINNSCLPALNGEVRFTSEKYLVIANQKAHFLINLSHLIMLSQVDNKAVFRTEYFPAETTTMWIKNLIDKNTQVTIFLSGDRQITGQITRFSHDHLDLHINQVQKLLIPLYAIQVIRSLNEN